LLIFINPNQTFMRIPHLLLAACAFSCARPRQPAYGPYRNLDRGYLTEGKIRQPLHGRPKQITEYILSRPDTAGPQARHGFFVRFAYNWDGDMIYKHTYMNDTVVGSIDYRYDAGGIHDKSAVGNQTSILTSRRLPDGRFKVIDSSFKGILSSVIMSFSPDGSEQTEESYSDTSAQGRPVKTVHIYYDGGKMVRIESNSSDGYQEWHWIYSLWNSPDSILAYTGRPHALKLASRAIFYNNDHGDPVREITIYGADTMADRLNRYVYDRHGNWTQKIETTLKDKTGRFGNGEVAVWYHEIEY